MANALTVNSQHRVGKRLMVSGSIALSGNYATGGEVVDFWASGVRSIDAKPEFMQIGGQAGFLYEYDKANGKVTVRGQEPTSATAGVIALSQLAAAAYPAAVSADVITFFALFR